MARIALTPPWHTLYGRKATPGALRPLTPGKRKSMRSTTMLTTADFNARGVGKLPGLLGIETIEVGCGSSHEPIGDSSRVAGAPTAICTRRRWWRWPTPPVVMAPSPICRRARRTSPPSNSRATSWGRRVRERSPVWATRNHGGRTTQVWDATVTDAAKRPHHRALSLHATHPLSPLTVKEWPHPRPPLHFDGEGAGGEANRCLTSILSAASPIRRRG